MLAHLKPSAMQGLSREVGATYAGRHGDPFLEYDLRAPRFRKGFLLLVVRPLAGSFSPRLYLDEGEGFAERRSIPLRAGGREAFHVPLAVFPNLRRVRFDPADGPCRVEVRALWLRHAPVAGSWLYLAGGVEPQRASAGSKPRSRLGGLVKTVRDAPGFFRWIGSAESLFRASRRSSMPSFMRRLEELCLRQATARPPCGGLPHVVTFVTPVFNSGHRFLDDLVSSFRRENAAGLCRLLLCDDASSCVETKEALSRLAVSGDGVEVLWAQENGGISAATNIGVFAARSRWISFIDHDDAFAPGGVARILDALARHPHASFFYTDEAITLPDLEPDDVFAKPAYDPVLLSGMNYVNHFSVYQTARVRALGGLRSSRDGSQDYDLLLRYLDGVPEGEVVHVPYPAYLWRRTGSTFSVAYARDAERRARWSLGEVAALDAERRGLPAPGVRAADAVGLHRLDHAVEEGLAITVVIPNKDSHDLLKRVLEGLLSETDGFEGRLEIVVVDNGSKDAKTLALYRRLVESGRIRLEMHEEPFNFARQCNRGARLASHDLVLFLNNDVEVVEPGWLEEMASCLSFQGTAMVGARLLYPDRTVQHNGVVVGLAELAGHWYCGAPWDEPGPMARFFVRQSMSCVTAACMLVRRDVFEELGGFDERVFPVAYNDVDLCLRLRRAGHRIVWTPFATLVHHESKSRGSDEGGANARRFERDKANLKARHDTSRIEDPAYSPLWGRWLAFPAPSAPFVLPRSRTNALAWSPDEALGPVPDDAAIARHGVVDDEVAGLAARAAPALDGSAPGLARALGGSAR